MSFLFPTLFVCIMVFLLVYPAKHMKRLEASKRKNNESIITPSAEDDWDRRFTEALEWAEQKELGIFGRKYTIHKEAERLQKRREAVGGRGITTNTLHVAESKTLNTLTVSEGGVYFNEPRVTPQDRMKNIQDRIHKAEKDLAYIERTMNRWLANDDRVFSKHIDPEYRDLYIQKDMTGTIVTTFRDPCECISCIIDKYDEDTERLKKEIETCKRELKY